MPVSVYSDSFVRAARFALSDGPVVPISMSELRRAHEHSPESDNKRKLGPFNIDTFNRFVEVPRRRTLVQMQFGPFHDLDRDEIRLRGGGYVSRPQAPSEFYQMAEIVLSRIRAGRISFGQFVERVQELNPALVVVREREGSVSREEVAYVLRVNHLRAVKNFEEEILFETTSTIQSSQ
jgi:hypothetical protein